MQQGIEPDQSINEKEQQAEAPVSVAVEQVTGYAYQGGSAPREVDVRP